MISTPLHNSCCHACSRLVFCSGWTNNRTRTLHVAQRTIIIIIWWQEMFMHNKIIAQSDRDLLHSEHNLYIIALRVALEWDHEVYVSCCRACIARGNWEFNCYLPACLEYAWAPIPWRMTLRYAGGVHMYTYILAVVINHFRMEALRFLHARVSISARASGDCHQVCFWACWQASDRFKFPTSSQCQTCAGHP